MSSFELPATSYRVFGINTREMVVL